jgi:hypothetical protein
MSSAEQPHEEEHHDEVASSYVPPPPKSIGELVAADQEDESLRKYKETLLGNAIAENIVIGFYIISCTSNSLMLKWFLLKN